jgi:DNA polymerase elongation subunit (family B)
MPPVFENPLLFGTNPEVGIVAVEFDGTADAIVFTRLPDGATVSRREQFSPMLWSAVPLLDSVDLAGGEKLRFLTRFPDWSAFQSQRSALKSADFEWFAINDPVQQFLTITGRTLFKGMEFPEVRRMQVDIETACEDGYAFSSPERDPLTAIAISDNSGWEEFIAVDPANPASEKHAIERLNVLIAERDPDVIEGHNIFKFDIPFLTARAKLHRLRLKWGRDGSGVSSRSSRLQIAEKTIQYPRCSIHGRHVVDTFILAQLYDVGTRELDGFGLKSVAAHFGLTEPNRVVLDGAELQSVRISDPKRFESYALQDVRETRALSSTLAPSYFVQAQIFPYNFQDVITRGNATKINALFLRAYFAGGHALPGLPEAMEFEGGYTDIFFTGVMRDVWHCDVASLYPSVILEFGLLPAGDSLGVFRSMLTDLRHYRLEAKARVRAAENESDRLRFDALQSVFKILINSFYGYLGFSQGHFADFHTAAAVTAKGREILRLMVEWLTAQGAKVIEIDTDGIYFQPPVGVSVEVLDAGMRDVLPDGIEVDFDKKYAAMFSYKAKNYALLDECGKVTLKGAALKSRGMEPFLRDFLVELIGLLLAERPDALPALHARYVGEIRGRLWNVAKLAKTEALQDSLAAYQKKIESSARNRSAAFEVALRSGRNYQAGDQVAYYITGTKKKVTAYDHAKPVADWNPDDRDENVEYYVGKLDELYKKFADFAAASESQPGFDF